MAMKSCESDGVYGRARGGGWALRQGGAGLPKISPVSFPLHCLVCCQAFAEPENSLPGRTHGIAKQLRKFAQEADGGPHDIPHPLRAPPLYVRQLLATEPENRGRVIEELRRQVGPVGCGARAPASSQVDSLHLGRS